MSKFIILTACVFSTIIFNTAIADDNINDEDFNNYVYEDENNEYTNDGINYIESYDDDIDYNEDDMKTEIEDEE